MGEHKKDFIGVITKANAEEIIKAVYGGEVFGLMFSDFREE